MGDFGRAAFDCVSVLFSAVAFAAAGETKLLNQLVAEGRPRKKGRRRNNGKRNKLKRVYVNGCWRAKTLSGSVPRSKFESQLMTGRKSYYKSFRFTSIILCAWNNALRNLGDT